jgi:DNA modification methylase
MQLQIKTVSVEKLIPYVKNSRTHSDAQVAQIAASIKEFGWTNPILVDGENGVIAGHGRLLAARKLGHKEVPVIELAHMTDSQKRAYVIADNQLAMNAGWDTTILSLELADLKEQGFDLDVLGFDAKEMDKLLEPEQVDGLTDEDVVPEAPVEPKTKLGDIYQLGNHRLMCGDSADINCIDKLLNGTIPNAIVTDPPYGIGIDGQKQSISANPKHNRKYHEKKGWDNSRPDEGIFGWIVTLNVPSVIWGGNYFADLLPATRGWLYWSKGQDGLTMSDGELAWTTEDKPLRSKTINRSALKGSIHPTQKPVEIIKFSIEYLKVPTKGIVLDLFAGSGTAAIACEKMDMKAYLMEQDAGYCDAIVKRWEDFTGKKAVLLTES